MTYYSLDSDYSSNWSDGPNKAICILQLQERRFVRDKGFRQKWWTDCKTQQMMCSITIHLFVGIRLTTRTSCKHLFLINLVWLFLISGVLSFVCALQWGVTLYDSVLLQSGFVTFVHPNICSHVSLPTCGYKYAFKKKAHADWPHLIIIPSLLDGHTWKGVSSRRRQSSTAELSSLSLFLALCI